MRQILVRVRRHILWYHVTSYVTVSSRIFIIVQHDSRVTVLSSYGHYDYLSKLSSSAHRNIATPAEQEPHPGLSHALLVTYIMHPSTNEWIVCTSVCALVN